MAIQVACDTAVNGCVFLIRSEDDDRERLITVAREHVNEQHGKDLSREEIEAEYLVEVDVPTA